MRGGRKSESERKRVREGGRERGRERGEREHAAITAHSQCFFTHIRCTLKYVYEYM